MGAFYWFLQVFGQKMLIYRQFRAVFSGWGGVFNAYAQPE